MRSTRLLRRLVLVVLFAGASAAAQDVKPKPSVPVEPKAAIVQALRTHPVVALGEGDHNNEQGHAFRLALLRDPAFLATVNDIVVEFGNARFQPIMDRFVNGEDVAPGELRKAWQDTSQPHAVWDVPIYEAFFRAVREVNAKRPADRRIRVLLGDPPVDWTGVTAFRDINAQMGQVGDRDTYPAQLIQREVLAKGRRALLIYGDQHLARTPADSRTGCQPGSTIPCFPGTIVDQLKAAGVQVFNITTITGADLRSLQGDIAGWPVPSLSLTDSTVLGQTPYRAFLPAGPLMIGPDGKPQPEPPSVRRPMQAAFDAVLYLGPPSAITYSHLTAQLCADPDYVKMRSARMALTSASTPAPCAQAN